MLIDENATFSRRAWLALNADIDRVANTASAIASQRRGKSWLPWMMLLREHLAPKPAEVELREAVLWHVRDQGTPSVKIFAEPRVFPVLKSGRRVPQFGHGRNGSA